MTTTPGFKDIPWLSDIFDTNFDANSIFSHAELAVCHFYYPHYTTSDMYCTLLQRLANALSDDSPVHSCSEVAFNKFFTGPRSQLTSTETYDALIRVFAYRVIDIGVWRNKQDDSALKPTTRPLANKVSSIQKYQVSLRLYYISYLLIPLLSILLL